MPVFEFRCTACDARFEELVGSHVGTTVEDVRCPECGSADLERLTSSSYATNARLQTPNQRRAREQARGTGDGGAMKRFKQQRAAEKRTKGGDGGG